ncbi:hypothetical protein ACMATS_06405 [Streptoverticillium reticulum]|uniref:hypothetical protein n=1 Tax=Streptoverticillium reticulum TaxID=1433415 RepID=UPI0039BFFF57
MRLLLRWMVRRLRPRRMRRPPMTAHLVFTDHEPGTHGRFRSASARGRHGTYYVIEDNFTWTLMLLRHGSNRALTTVGFRAVGEEAARRIEQAEDPSNATVYHLAAQTYREHQTRQLRERFTKDTTR